MSKKLNIEGKNFLRVSFVSFEDDPGAVYRLLNYAEGNDVLLADSTASYKRDRTFLDRVDIGLLIELADWLRAHFTKVRIRIDVKGNEREKDSWYSSQELNGQRFFSDEEVVYYFLMHYNEIKNER